VEDGCLQGLLEMAGVPYAGSDVRGSAAGMDKELTKAVLAAASLPHLPYEIVGRNRKYSFASSSTVGDAGSQTLSHLETTLDYPMIIKPAVLGSSVAVSIASSRSELEKALDLALRFCDRALVERALIEATEINCAVLDGDPPIPSVLEQPMKPGTLLTFEEKYKAGGGKNSGSKTGGKGQGMAGQQRIIPAPLDEATTERIKELAVAAFQAVGAGGVARIDFLIAGSGEIYINELNNIPGSLSYYLWEPLGKSFGQLIEKMVERAFEVNKRRNRTTFAFEANLLAGR
jgi:D-alanine-D-alanine ligase